MVFNNLGAAYLGFSALHLALLVLAAVAAGLYGADLNDGRAGDGRWVYAVVVAVLSALTALLYLLPFVLRFMAVWIWDFVLFVLWIAVFGVFGKVSASPGVFYSSSLEGCGIGANIGSSLSASRRPQAA